jgi:hypothetical protein
MGGEKIAHLSDGLKEKVMAGWQRLAAKKAQEATKDNAPATAAALDSFDDCIPF